MSHGCHVETLYSYKRAETTICYVIIIRSNMYSPHVQRSSFLVQSSRPLPDSPIQRLPPWCSHIVIQSCCVSQSNMKPLTALRRQCDSSIHMCDIDDESSLISGDTRYPLSRLGLRILYRPYGTVKRIPQNQGVEKIWRKQACGLTCGWACGGDWGGWVAPFSKP